MKKAFTMVELVLVVVIVVIASVSLLGTFITCMALNDNSRMMTTAMNIARDRIEDMVNRSKSDWSYASSMQIGNAVLSQAPPVGYNFNGSCAIDVYSPPGIANLKFVRVVVCWRTKNGRIVGTDNAAGAGAVQLDGIPNGSEQTVDWNGINVLDSPVVLATAILQS